MRVGGLIEHIRVGWVVGLELGLHAAQQCFACELSYCGVGVVLEGRSESGQSGRAATRGSTREREKCLGVRIGGGLEVFASVRIASCMEGFDAFGEAVLGIY